jgi:hypothetical protein
MKKLFVIFAISLLLFVNANAQQPPLMGWSSWNTYGVKINDSLIKTQADVMVRLGFLEKGYRYINIDDGYFGGRDEKGNLLIHPKRFPNGLKGLVDYIHALGLKAGIYTDAGKNTCASYWGNPKDTIGIGVGLYGHEAEDLRLFFDELDFDFLKVDYCGADARNNIDRLDLEEEKRFKEIAKHIKGVEKKEVSWNVCRWAFPGTWVSEIADSWRMSEDIYLGWESIKSIIHQNLYLSAYASFGHYNDMDMLEVGRGLSEEEDKTHFGMWCMMSSPLLIGCDLNSIQPNAVSLLQNEELIALNQDLLGLQAYVVERKSDCYILVKDIEKRYGNKRAVAVYNPSEKAQTVSVDFALFDLDGKIKVRNVYERKDIGTFKEEFIVNIPPHATRIYTLEANKRLERSLYEAETAWLSAYQELETGETTNTAIYEEVEGLSGGAVVKNLGYNSKNDLQWRNVYSKEGGEYEITIFFFGKAESINIVVNDNKPIQLTLNENSSVVSLKHKLKKGENTIRLYTESEESFAVDCMNVQRE